MENVQALRNELNTVFAGDDVATAADLVKLGVTFEDVEQFFFDATPKRAQTGRTIMGHYISTKVPGFNERDTKRKISHQMGKAINDMGVSIVAYLVSLKVKTGSVNMSNVSTFLCAQNQLERATVSFKDGSYSLSDVDNKIDPVVIPVQNCMPILSEKTIDEIKKVVHINNATSNSGVGAGVAMAFVSAFKAVKEQGKQNIVSFRPVDPPKGMASVGKLSSHYDNPWLTRLSVAMLKIATPLKDDVDIINFICSAVSGMDQKIVEKICEKMLQAPQQINMGALKNMEIGNLFVHLNNLLPTYKNLSKCDLTGCPRVTSALKFLPPLMFLAAQFTKIGDRECAMYFGANGGAHIRAIETYFDVEGHCYDISPVDQETDRRNGIYRIKQADFYKFDYNADGLPKILIEDVYDPNYHKKDKFDRGMHKKASCLLKFTIYSEDKGGRPQGREINLDRILLKARLPDEPMIAYYSEAYPFIACKTGHGRSNEMYCVTYRDKGKLKDAYYKVIADSKHDSKSMHIYCMFIDSEVTFRKFIKAQLIIRVVTLYTLNQQTVWTPLKAFRQPFSRDWTLPSKCMPVTYLPKKKRNIYGTHLIASSQLVDGNNEGFDILVEMGLQQEIIGDALGMGLKEIEKELDKQDPQDELGDVYGVLEQAVLAQDVVHDAK